MTINSDDAVWVIAGLLLCTACGGSTDPETRNLPAAPTALQVSPTSRTTTHLSWQDNADDEAGFKVYRGASAEAVLDLVSTEAANVERCDDTGLDPGATYHYRVYSFNDMGQSIAYGSASIVMPALPAIVLSRSEVVLEAAPGEGAPNIESVAVSNAGSGTIGGLTVAVTYAVGESQGWLGAQIDESTTPATVSLEASITDLLGGLYHAEVTVSSTVVGIEPRSIAVTLTVPRRLVNRVIFAVGGSATSSGMATVKDDGSDVDFVVTGSTYYSPDVSPDGMLIVVNWDDSGVPMLRTLDAAGTIVRDFGEGAVGRWSPDGEKIVYHRSTESSYSIWVVNRDGSGGETLTMPPSGRFDLFASWSPDATSVTWGRGGPESVWIKKLSTGATSEITSGFFPSFSPDGAQVVLTRNGAVVLHHLGTAEETTLPNWPDGLAYCPAVSPDGTAIVTVNGPPTDFNRQLVIMNADGSHQRLLFEDPTGKVSCPRWTPDW
jgi:hypothetical protein